MLFATRNDILPECGAHQVQYRIRNLLPPLMCCLWCAEGFEYSVLGDFSSDDQLPDELSLEFHVL
jgi:hypothetical protein